MQDLLSILIFPSLLIMAVASHGDKDVSKKVWSALLSEGTPVVKGVGTWKIRLISEIKKPFDTWNKSMGRMMMPSQKKNNSDTLTVPKYLTDHASSKVMINKPKYASVEIPKDYHSKDTNFVMEDDIKSVTPIYAGRSVSENNANSVFETYKNWVGKNNKFETYKSSNFTQPTWQLPASKFNESQGSKENLTVYPLSVLHRMWQKTDKIKRIDELNENDFDFENDTFFRISQATDIDCNNECVIRRSGNEIQKVDLDAESTFQERGSMGGGQPILLIKDQGGPGGSDVAHPPSGKDSLGPLIMMMTPLIMMCIMIPMMMSVMGGMMSFMKSMATLMMMLTWPSNGSQAQQALITKQRQIGEFNENRTNEFLNSFILELSERLEEALRKYDN